MSVEYFKIDTDAICNDSGYIVASALAKEVKRIGIATTGTLLAALPDSIIQYFALMLDHDPHSESFQTDAALATMVCLTAEGIEISDDVISTQVNSFYSFMIVESLARKGMVDVDRNNWSLGEDAKHLTVAEITEKGRQFVKK